MQSLTGASKELSCVKHALLMLLFLFGLSHAFAPRHSYFRMLRIAGNIIPALWSWGLQAAGRGTLVSNPKKSGRAVFLWYAQMTGLSSVMNEPEGTSRVEQNSGLHLWNRVYLLKQADPGHRLAVLESWCLFLAVPPVLCGVTVQVASSSVWPPSLTSGCYENKPIHVWLAPYHTAGHKAPAKVAVFSLCCGHCVLCMCSWLWQGCAEGLPGGCVSLSNYRFSSVLLSSGRLLRLLRSMHARPACHKQVACSVGERRVRAVSGVYQGLGNMQ